MLSKFYKKYNISNKVTYSINLLLILYAFSLPFPFAKHIAAAIFFLWFVEANYKTKISCLLKTSSVKALILFTIYIFLSILWTEAPFKEVFSYIFQHKYILISLVMLTSLKKQNIPNIINAFLLGMFISELISYGIFFEVINMGYPHQFFATPNDPAPFFDHLDYSVFLAITALFLLYKIIKNKNHYYKAYFALFFISSTTNLFLIGGRTGQIAFIFSIILLFLFSFKKKIKAIFIALVLIITILFLAINISATFKSRAINAQKSISEVILEQDYHSSWGQRAACWIVSGEIISHNLFLGTGLKDNLVYFKETVKNGPEEYKVIAWFPHLHSEYLEITTSLGIIGLILFLSIFYFIVTYRYQDKELQITKIIFLSVFFIAFFTDPFLEKKAVLLLFGVLYGLLLVQYKYEQQNGEGLNYEE